MVDSIHKLVNKFKNNNEFVDEIMIKYDKENNINKKKILNDIDQIKSDNNFINDSMDNISNILDL